MAGMLFLLCYAVATIGDGLMRAIFSSAIHAVRDLGNLVVAVSVACVLPLSFQAGSHIVVEFVSVILPKRLADALTLFGATMTLVVLVLFGWEFFRFAQLLVRNNEVTAMLRWPMAPFWFVIDGVFWVAALVQLSVVISATLSFGRVPRDNGPPRSPELVSLGS